MAQPFDSEQDINSRQLQSLVESVTNPGQAAQAVCNPDGTDLFAGGGGGATAAKQDTGNTSLASIDGKLPTIGVTTPSASVSFVNSQSTSFAVGQQAITNAAAKLNGGTATAFKNGFVLRNMSTSTASFFYGLVGVTSTTGDEIIPGGSVVIPVADISTVYVIAVSSGTARASWGGFN